VQDRKLSFIYRGDQQIERNSIKSSGSNEVVGFGLNAGLVSTPAQIQEAK